MSARTNANAVRRLREAAIDAAWVQWYALGGQVASRTPLSIVDPEALLIATVAFADDEPRLRDMLTGFIQGDTRRISVQRLRRISQSFPERVNTALGRFAHRVAGSGDRRWKRIAGGRPFEIGRPGKVEHAGKRLMHEGSLMLRVRAAFGVDVRADVLTFLLGNQGAPAGIREIKTQLGYVTNSISRACESLLEAGLVTSRSERPVRYSLKWSAWQQFLGIIAPAWHPWCAIYSVTVSLHDWLAEHGGREMSRDMDRMLAGGWLAQQDTKAIELIELENRSNWSFMDLTEAFVNRLQSWA